MNTVTAGTGFAGRPAMPLTVLLADSEGERARMLKERLRELSDAVIVRVATTGNLLDAVRSVAPDVIIVDMALSDRDALDDLRRVNLDNPRPVVMFVDRDDRAFMEEAIAAGVSSYNVVDTAFPDVKPIVMAAVAIFRKYQQVSADLHLAKTRLMEREAVDKAKVLLMRRRKIDEPQAYRWLRRKAMNENKRIAAVAAELLAAEAQEDSSK
jgi:two-component system, response regulator / RNA-binding antiterminator